MKRLLAAVVLFCLILSAYLSGYFYIKQTCNQANELLSDCIKEYELKNSAVESAERLENFWQKKEKLLSVFANHTEIDEIELTISTLKVYSSTDDKVHFSEYSGNVKILLHQLHEDIIPSIHSIL